MKPSDIERESRTDLGERKLRAEIRLLEAEFRATSVRTRLDLFKGIAVGVAAIVAFWFVQSPDSAMNRQASRETIARERAALILDSLKEDDPLKRRQALAVIHAVYGNSEDRWLRDVEAALKTQASAEIAESEAQQELRTARDTHATELYLIKERLARELQIANAAYLSELYGTGGSGHVGYGPVARARVKQLRQIKARLEDIDKQIEVYQEEPGAKSR